MSDVNITAFTSRPVSRVGEGACLIYRTNTAGQTFYGYRRLGALLPRGARPIGVVAGGYYLWNTDPDLLGAAPAQRLRVRAAIAAGSGEHVLFDLLNWCADLHPRLAQLADLYGDEPIAPAQAFEEVEEFFASLTVEEAAALMSAHLADSRHGDENGGYLGELVAAMPGGVEAIVGRRGLFPAARHLSHTQWVLGPDERPAELSADTGRTHHPR